MATAVAPRASRRLTSPAALRRPAVGSKVLLVRHAASTDADGEPSEFALKCVSKRMIAIRGTALHAVRERRALQRK